MRKFGFTLLVVGALGLTWLAVTYFYGDPVTGYIAHARNARLVRAYATEVGPHAKSVEQDAALWQRLPEGRVVGLLTIPALGLRHVAIIQGAALRDLDRGPGHVRFTSMPGAGARHTVYIAGHRTTWGAWFRHIDSMHPGDRIYVRTPYGRFVYAVLGHRVVRFNDWSIVRPRRPWERLVLSACHPPHSKTYRYVIFAARV